MEIIEEYKEWVENKKGFAVLRDVSSRNEEKVVQKTLHGSATYYCKNNDLDISPEANSGRGPADYKISRGRDKTCIWGARLSVEIIIDNCNSRDWRKYRFQIFCYGPLLCKLFDEMNQ